MYEDEMTEKMWATAGEEYHAVTRQEKHDDALDKARAYIRSLEAMVCMLKRQKAQDTFALVSLHSRL